MHPRLSLPSMTKVLVAYASKRGATVEIAEAIAEKLRERHLVVDCRPARSVENLFGYDAVIIGSAVYFNRWRPDAMRFLRRHASRLADLPFWTFSSGPVGNTPASGQLEPHRERVMAEMLHARGHVVFGGRVQPRRSRSGAPGSRAPDSAPVSRSARLGGDPGLGGEDRRRA